MVINKNLNQKIIILLSLVATCANNLYILLIRASVLKHFTLMIRDKFYAEIRVIVFIEENL